MSIQNLEPLRQFFGAYFHQDWDLDAPDYNGVVDRYIADTTDKRSLRDLANCLEVLSDSYDADVELEDALGKELWCEFVPSGDGLSARTWVLELAHRLRAASI